MPSVSAEAHAALVALSQVDGRVETEGHKILAQLRRDVVEEVLAALYFVGESRPDMDLATRISITAAARRPLETRNLVWEILNFEKNLEPRAAHAAKSFSPVAPEAAA